MKKLLGYLFLFISICGVLCQNDLTQVCTGVDSGFRKHPNDRECQKYISCVRGIAHVLQCPGNLYFDRCKQDRCVRPSELVGCTENCKPCPLTGTLNLPSDTPNQCHEYYMCVNGDQLTTKCANGMLFDSGTRSCRPFQEVTNCQLYTCLITKGFHVALAPDLSDCRKYFVCQNGEEQFSLTCAAGRKYSMRETDRIDDIQFRGRCVSDTEPIECFNGQNFPEPTKVTQNN